LGQVRAARRTVDELRQDLEERYKKYYIVPAVTVTPLRVNTKLEDLRDTVDSRAGFGGQSIQVRVAPDGTIQLPALGSVPAHGLTLAELKAEIDARYEREVEGIEVTPILQQRAPRYAYVLGEVETPGRYELTGPTTVSQAIAMAGGWNNGGNLRHIVMFRRAEDWRLLATRLDLNGALLGKRPCPSDEIWVRDSDIVLVPKSAILRAADFIDLVFTRCIYGVIPLTVSVDVGALSLF
jgi:polysaccharide export outer membrane protein